MATAPTTPLLDRAADLELSVTALAAEFGVTSSRMAEWLVGATPVPDDVAPALAERLQVDVAALRPSDRKPLGA